MNNKYQYSTENQHDTKDNQAGIPINGCAFNKAPASSPKSGPPQN